MGDRASSGFTIVETTLFLAVTGALIAGMIFATSATISVQRYRDATESFKALLQSQFSEVTNVQNSRDNARACSSQAAVTDGDVFRGQSDCVLLGKYMTIRGGDVAIYPVLGSEIPGAAEPVNDIQALRDSMRLNLSTTEVVKQKIEWDVRIDWADEGNAEDTSNSGGIRQIAFLFVRSPTSGQVYTFSTNSVPTESWIENTDTLPAHLRNIIRSGQTVPGQKGRTICLAPAVPSTIPNTAIYIAPFAAAASAVEVRSNDTASTLGVAERC